MFIQTGTDVLPRGDVESDKLCAMIEPQNIVDYLDYLPYTHNPATACVRNKEECVCEMVEYHWE